MCETVRIGCVKKVENKKKMKYEKPKLIKYGNQNHFVEKAIIVFFVLWGIATIFNMA